MMKYLHIIYLLLPIALLAILSCEEDKGDTSPPEVSIISPLNGSTVNEITNVNVNATDDEEVDFVRFFINDSLDSSLVSAEPYSYAWNTNKLDDGQYRLSVMAQDASGNTSDTIEAVYTVDNTISIPAAVEIVEITYGLNLMSIRFNKSQDADFSEYTILASANSQGNEAVELGKINDINDTLFTTTEFDPTQESWYFIKVSDIYGYFEIGPGYNVIDSPPTLSTLTPPKYEHGTIQFQWSICEDNDFYKYHLYSSNSDDMSNKQLLVTNNIRNDTTHAILIDFTDEKKYYQVDVEDHWGFITPGNVIQANLPYKVIKNFGGTQNDRGYAIQSTIDGYIIVGSTNSYGSGGTDVWVLKLDFEGQEQWSRTYGGSGNDVGRDIKVTSNPAGYIITGHTSSFNSSGNIDMWLIRTDEFGQTCLYDEDGNCTESQEKWTKTFGYSGNDYGYSVTQSDNEFIAVGKSSRIPSFYAVKVNSEGEKIWEKFYGEGPNDKAQYIINTTIQLPKYIIVGQSNDPNTSDSDISIFGINSDGSEHWNRTIQYGNSVNELGKYIFPLSGGGFLVAGAKHINNWDDLFLMKVNNDGTQSGSWYYGGSYNEVGNYAQEVSGGYLVSGYTESFGQGLYDVWIVKTDLDGNEIFNHTFGGSLDDKAMSGTSSTDGDPVVIGYTKSFGNGGEDIFFIKVDQSYQP